MNNISALTGQQRHVGLNILWFLAFTAIVITLAVFSGLLASTGSVLLIGGFVGGIAGLVLLFSPNLLFAAGFVFSLAVGGLAQFYFGIGQASWISSWLAASLWAATILKNFRSGSLVIAHGRKMGGVGLFVSLYITALLMAAALNEISAKQFVVGLRNYLPFIGVYIALRYALSRKLIDIAPSALVVIGLVQLPFILHQFTVVGAQRRVSTGAVGGEAEAIVGTFGGHLLGGGYTGEMAVFLLLASCIALVVYGGGGNKFFARAMPLAAVGCVALAETKIIFVLTPFVLSLVFWEEIKEKPSRLLALLAWSAVALGVLAGVYSLRFWWAGGFAEFLHAFTYSFDPDFMVTEYHRGRIGTLIHWWNMNPASGDLLHTSFGYGMASTLEASRVLGEGNAVRIFGYGLDSHAVSKLLWDSGVVGLGLFCLIILRTAMNAHRLISIHGLSVAQRGMLKVSRSAMFVFMAMLPYQISVVGGAPMQLLFWFFVGYVAYWRWQYLCGAIAK